MGYLVRGFRHQAMTVHRLPTVCAKHCSVCEGQDHHWMPDFDEESGDPIMVCKHCDAEKPYPDDEVDL